VQGFVKQIVKKVSDSGRMAIVRGLAAVGTICAGQRVTAIAAFVVG
jgi:hypothetical protein